jgi:hypothetical protein
MRTLLTLTLLALTTGIAARADITYYYTGKDFSDGSSLTGYITLASPFGDNLNFAGFSPKDFSLTDGSLTMTPSNNVYAVWQMSTDASGDPTNWSIVLEGGPNGEYFFEMIISNGGLYGVGDTSAGQQGPGAPDVFHENFVAGSFSTTPPGTSTVPEPSSVALLMTALAGACVVARRARSKS